MQSLSGSFMNAKRILACGRLAFLEEYVAEFS